MGNQLLKKYEPDESNEADGGPFLKWRCIPGRHRDRQHESVTLFVFEKTPLDVIKNRYHRESILDTLRKDCSNLQKLRHPSILPLLEPLNEDKLSLVFATKPVCKTVADILSNSSKLEGAQFQNKKSSKIPLAIRTGLADICEALVFLHQDAKLAHLNISPTSIFISPQGRWYLGSLGYAKDIQEQSNHSHLSYALCNFTFNQEFILDNACFYVDPCLNYCAPEITSTTPTCSFASDVFSFGLLIAQLASSQHEGLIQLKHNGDVFKHQQVSTTIHKSVIISGFESALSTLLPQMLSPNPADRPGMIQILHSPFFNDALRFLETIQEKTEIQQIQFLNGFKVLLLNDSGEFIKNTEFLRERVLPPLLLLLSVPDLRIHLLPTLFLVIRTATNPLHFIQDIWPYLCPLLSAKEIQINAVVQLISELDFFMSLSTDLMIEEHFLPFVIKCLGIPIHSIQYPLLHSLSATARRFSSSILRISVLPCLLNVLSDSNSSATIKVKGLHVIGQISDKLDRATITDKVIVSIHKAAKTDRHAIVTVACAETLNTLSQIVGRHITSETIIPILASLPAEENLTPIQFNLVFNILMQQLETMAEERRKRFQIEGVLMTSSPPLTSPHFTTETILHSPMESTYHQSEDTFKHLLFGTTQNSLSQNNEMSNLLNHSSMTEGGTQCHFKSKMDQQDSTQQYNTVSSTNKPSHSSQQMTTKTPFNLEAQNQLPNDLFFPVLHDNPRTHIEYSQISSSMTTSLNLQSKQERSLTNEQSFLNTKQTDPFSNLNCFL